MAHKRKGHTGKIKHHDMETHLDGHGGRDKHAHEKHHEYNAHHDMHEGMSPIGEYDGGHEHGGEGMAGNCCYEDG